MPKPPRFWFIRPQWYWFGWGTLIPFHLGGDEFDRWTVVFGWTITGRIVVAVGHPAADSEMISDSRDTGEKP